MLSTSKKLRPKFEPVPQGIDYFLLPQVSNSDLSGLYYETKAVERMGNIDKAYAFGSLIDAVITEPERVNVFKYKLDGQPFSKLDLIAAFRMRDSFFKDRDCVQLLKYSECQRVMIRNVPLQYRGFSFVLPMRCKWDGWLNSAWWGWDLKSTAATSQQQFDAACKHFDYDRQRAVYMTIAGSDQDMIIGISKVNFKVFKKRIKKGDEFYKAGMSKFLELALKYHVMYG
jgi:hypothetical protein